MSFCDVIAITVLFLLYGPYANFRDWLITTAMGTMNHQYLATTFYSMDKIEKVLSSHSTIEPDFNTDTSLIIAKEGEYIDDYDREILDRNKDDIYKLIEIDEAKKFFEAETKFNIVIADINKIIGEAIRDVM